MTKVHAQNKGTAKAIVSGHV